MASPRRALRRRAELREEQDSAAGYIAANVTGATDLASRLVKNGMRSAQLLGVPAANKPAPPAEALRNQSRNPINFSMAERNDDPLPEGQKS